MKLVSLAAVCAAAGCLGVELDEEPVETSEVESESVPTTSQGTPGQGSTMQGSTMQGSTMQGSTMQGSTMQGSTMQGSYGGSGVSSAGVSGTAIHFMKKVGSQWQRRWPDKICYFSDPWMWPQGCTTYDLATQQSPLVGSTWPTTFTKTNSDGTTSTIDVTLEITAVRRDPTYAMHPINSSQFATATPVSCENPDGCRPNRDIFNYDVKAIDVLDANGNAQWLCPSGQTAIALAGRWLASNNYAYSPSTTHFTFACTNGVIAKCTRWGYRPYDKAIRDNDQRQILMSLQPYHQACLRAATADYCGIGHSMTKDGTAVDIYDYSFNGSLPDDFDFSSGVGFIPKLDGFVYPNHDTVSAFAFEGSFAGVGGSLIDHVRYEELASQGMSIDTVCPGRFALDVDNGEMFHYTYTGDTDPPYVSVMSAPGCSHSEYKTGKYLHESCSRCTEAAPADCNDPTKGWSQACVDWVKANDDTSNEACGENADRMALHSECEIGPALLLYDTGCTLTVCSAYPACCNPKIGSWSSSCVSAANSMCTGGGESRISGFCSTSKTTTTSPPTTISQ